MTHTRSDNLEFRIICMEESHQSRNTEFYAACTKYFEALRKQGKNDDGFEDEFFYTMPVISGSK